MKVMTQVFPYIFYTFSKVYRAGLDRRDPDVYASGLTTVLQGFNILTIARYFLTKDEQINLAIAMSVILIFGNYFLFFNAKTLQKFDERWDGEPKGKRILKRTLVVMYVIMTFVLFFAL